MKNSGFNPQKIFWIAALLTLVLGILFFEVKFDFQYHDTYVASIVVHAAAIVSGLLSMISFAYSYLMKGNYSRFLAGLHVLLTLGLMIAIMYFNARHNSMDFTPPNLESTAVEIDLWRNNVEIRNLAMKSKMASILIWIALQFVFLASLLVTRSRRGK